MDNAESMDAHWFEATKLLKLLVKKTKGLDEDGMDLRFTTGKAALDNEKSPSRFVQKMQEARPKTALHERAHTDLRKALGDIMLPYLQAWKMNRQEIKDKVIIVLTDGIWAGMEGNKSALVDLIRKFAAELNNYTVGLKERPFGIEFIQFGRDPGATERLRYLDDLLSEDGTPCVDLTQAQKLVPFAIGADN